MCNSQDIRIAKRFSLYMNILVANSNVQGMERRLIYRQIFLFQTNFNPEYLMLSLSIQMNSVIFTCMITPLCSYAEHDFAMYIGQIAQIQYLHVHVIGLWTSRCVLRYIYVQRTQRKTDTFYVIFSKISSDLVLLCMIQKKAFSCE